jgi:GT2 family glycosyltransferase
VKVSASIVVLNWNTSNETIECLKSLENQTYKNFEVILIDQGSQREEQEKLKDFLKKEKNLRIRFIQNKRNVGFCEGNNIGIRKSRGDILVFLNNDTIVDRYWLENLVKPFDNPKVGVTGSKIFLYDGKRNDTIQYAGGKLTFLDAVMEGAGTKNKKEYDKMKETFWAMGASFAVQKKIFDELDELFPKEYFMYFEEVDLCWRIKNLGYMVVFCPKSVVYHKGSVSAKRSRTLMIKTKLNIRNRLLTFWRNLPTYQAFLLTPMIIGYDFLIAVKRLFQGDSHFLTSLILGILDFVRIYPKMKKPKLGSISQLSW